MASVDTDTVLEDLEAFELVFLRNAGKSDEQIELHRKQKHLRYYFVLV